jgi:hypothetical protein
MLYVKDLESNKGQDRKKELFKTILDECYRKIKTKHKDNIRFLRFVIPVIKIGYPLYNLGELVAYVYKKLKKGGFRVQLLSENKLYIDW